MPIGKSVSTKHGFSREERQCKVIALPVGPEDTTEIKLLFKGPRAEAVKFYDMIRQSGDSYPPALALIDGHDRPIYACSY